MASSVEPAGPNALLQRAPLVLLLASLGALAVAYTAEYGFGLDPCALCLYQRVPYAVVAVLALSAMVFPADPWRRVALAIAGMALVVGAGIALYHVGVEQDCLSPGKNIVNGTPSWVHFGKAQTEFDLQLAPGKHKLSLQIGDDLHNTMPGLCSTITVTVK